MPLPAATTVEARGARPVDELADERGLVAVGERIDDARVGRAPREQRAGERVGLDVHHHDVRAGVDRGQGMRNPRGRVSRGLYDDLDRTLAQHARQSVGDPRPSVVADVGRVDPDKPAARPSHGNQSLEGPLGVEVNDSGDLDPGRAERLG